MKKTITLLTALLPLASAIAEEPTLSPAMVSAAEVVSAQENQTYTYVRCWYRTSHSKDDAATDWKWAKNQDGSDFTIDGYWWSSVSFKNMFYTNTSQT